MLSFRSLFPIFLIAALVTSTFAGVLNIDLSHSPERCSNCEAKRYPLSDLIPQVHDRIIPLVNKMLSLSSHEITPEALGPIAKDITNALDDLTEQIFPDENASLDDLLESGSKTLADIAFTIASLVATIIGGITAVLKSASSGNLASVTQVLLEVVVTMVTLLLRLGFLPAGLLNMLIPMFPELLTSGLVNGATNVLNLLGL